MLALNKTVTIPPKARVKTNTSMQKIPGASDLRSVCWNKSITGTAMNINKSIAEKAVAVVVNGVLMQEIIRDNENSGIEK